MPTYLVRLDAGEGPDEGEPLDFCDDDAAARDSQNAMAEAAKEAIPGQHTAHLGVEIDGDQGKPVYRADLDFKGRSSDVQHAQDTADELPAGPRD